MFPTIPFSPPHYPADGQLGASLVSSVITFERFAVATTLAECVTRHPHLIADRPGGHDGINMKWLLFIIILKENDLSLFEKSIFFFFEKRTRVEL